MTPKERVTLAFQNKKPDRVPVSPELWDVTPIKVSGRPFYEYGFTSFGKFPLWKAQIDAYKFFECEVWIPVEPSLSEIQKRIISARSYFVNPDLIQTEVFYKTSKGNLKEIKYSVFDYDMWSLKQPVENLFEDMPKYEEFFFDDPCSLDYEIINEAYRETENYVDYFNLEQLNFIFLYLKNRFFDDPYYFHYKNKPLILFLLMISKINQ